MMQATIDIRMPKPFGLKDEKYQRMMEIMQESVADEYPNAIVRVRPSQSVSEISTFGLGKEGKQEVAEFLASLFDEGSAFDELNDEYY
jgi:DNA-damage-inducible protein I